MKRLLSFFFLVGVATGAMAQEIQPAGLPLSGGVLNGALDILGIPSNDNGPAYVFGVTGKSKLVYSVTGYAVDEKTLFVAGTATATAGSVANDFLVVNGTVFLDQSGQSVTTQHTTGIYGDGVAIGATGSAAWINGIVGVSGNQGAATVTNAVDIRGHNDINTGGGTLTNHYFLYQEISSAATNEYGAFFSGFVGVGTTAPTFDLDINGTPSAPLSSANWARLGSGNGAVIVTSTGARVSPGSSAGAGTFGAMGFYAGEGTPANVGRAEIEIEKIAASGTAPGAANLKLNVVCGTGAGSAKIIAYAGTSTTPVTIIDNVGSGVTGC